MALCAAADVRVYLDTVSGQAIPAGLTNGVIDGLITNKTPIVLSYFGVTAEGSLTGNGVGIAKDACVRLVYADLLIAMNPGIEGFKEQANSIRQQVLEDISQSLAHKDGGNPPGKRLRMRLT